MLQWLVNSPCKPEVAGSIPGSSPSDGTIVVSRVCEFVCQSELSYFVPGVRVRQLSKLSFRVVVILVSFFARAKVVKVTNSFLKLFSGLKSFVYPPRCKYCNSVVFHPLLYVIDISFLQNLRYFSMFF